MEESIAKLKEWIDGSDNIVFFGGPVQPEVEVPARDHPQPQLL